MSHRAEIVIDVDRDAAARYFYWTKLLFLLWRWGRRLARRQADALSYRIVDGVLYADQGIVWLRRRAVPLDRITSIELSRDPVACLVGRWNLEVYTAAHTLYSVAAATIYAPVEPEKLRRELLMLNENSPGWETSVAGS